MSHDPDPVVVGVDDSLASLEAVEWAAAEACSRELPLHIVHSWAWERVAPWTTEFDPLIIGDLERDGARLVAKCRALAEKHTETHAETHAEEPVEKNTALPVTTEVVEGSPAEVLLERAQRAALVVVGSRHLNAIARLALGSVSSALVSRASCPVVVVDGAPGSPEERPSVVAGVAGAAQDDAVLGFAFDRAHRLGLPVTVLHSWWSPLGDDQFPEQAQLDETVARWRGDYPEVDVQVSVVRGDPVDRLVAASASQNMLVVGRRSRRTRFGNLLGSVSLGVLHHAMCPVAIVPLVYQGDEPSGPGKSDRVFGRNCHHRVGERSRIEPTRAATRDLRSELVPQRLHP